MAEKSVFWTTGATGDGATPYTQAETIRWVRQWVLGDNATEGVHKGYENELGVTGTATPIQIDTGAAVVYGFPYWNTSAVNKTIATPAGNTRYDRVVLQADWSAQEVRIVVLSGVEGAGVPPSVTQTDGVTWEITLATLSITTGGVITVTDARSYLHPNFAIDENMLDASIAGDGLAGGNGTPLSVGVDGVTIETSGDQLRVKDAGIDADALAASVAGDGLAGGAGSALSVNVDGSTIETNADTLRVKDLGITTAKLAANAVDENKVATSVAGAGITGGGGAPLALSPDGATLELSGDTLRVKDGGIDVDAIAAAIAGLGLIGGGGSALAVNPDGITLEISGDAVQVKNDGIDDTKLGNRAIQIYRRQGGSASGWAISGTTTYTPTTVRMQVGSVLWTGGFAASGNIAVTFPVAFSNTPIVLAICTGADSRINVGIGTPTASGVTIYWEDVTAAATFGSMPLMWIAIGPE